MGDGKTRSSRFRSKNSREQPAPDTGRSNRSAQVEDAPPVAQVGRYVLLKQLGQGGMGVVYSAYDPDLDRKVALKLLQSDGHNDAEAARARLLREAQAMARVTHPNVVPIHDVGMWGEHVFLAMEMADEGTLSGWLEKERPWREVLEVFLAAGRGLLAAHEAGLVHRDFKPANVLLGRGGRVYVTDFGLARKMGEAVVPEEPLPEQAEGLVPPERRMLETTLTRSGVVMGTPNYMSPEQYEGGELDARSDQFSFCVALYWGLYRKRAFDSSRMRAFITSRRKEELVSARTQTLDVAPAPVVKRGPGADLIQEPPRDSKVPAWVRQTLMRGMSLEPAERFASMRELLEALSQERRRVQRQRWAAAACVAGVGLSVVGGAVYRQSQVCTGANALMAEVWGPDSGATLEKAFQATGRPGAGEMAARVTRVLEEYAQGWKRQSTQACEATRVHGVQTEELLSQRVVCLDRRRQDMRALVGVLAQADAKLVDQSLDAAYALPALSECADVGALSEQQRLPTDPSRRAEIARLGGELAGVKAMLDAGRYRPALEKGFSLEAPVLATGYLPLIAELRYDLGVLQSNLGATAESERLLTQALYDAESGRADRLKVFAASQLLVAGYRQKHFTQAESWGGLSEASLRRLGGEPILEADLLTNRANMAIAQERYPEARALLEKVRALQEKALPPGHPKHARTLFLLGRVLLDMDERPRAVALLEEALQKTRAALGPMHPDTGRRHTLLAGLLLEMGQPERALEHARAALAVRTATLGEQHPQVASAMDGVGQCLLKLGRSEESLATFERALALKRKALAPDDEELQYSYDGVGQALLRLGRTREAIEPLRRAVTFPTVSPDALAESGYALARALWSTDSRPEARAEARREATQARERFLQAGLAPRASEVDSWLESLPREPSSLQALRRSTRR
ncbi:serine/threonine-protein kinase [Cystobacter ferrugineus]|uniref:Protein kinase n=1 Tax=Cystobacter ferrugineus TaxID=83449 RepID=A0A1L9BG88_9BACT|nr:serine/threonine-protein kinase [Cystobacter ferrugineus]OJH41218.1 protein kinase [Cystobacter ferrugineus]